MDVLSEQIRIIGVTDYPHDYWYDGFGEFLSRLKRHALLFDQIYIPGLIWLLEDFENEEDEDPEITEVHANLEWLTSEAITIDYDFPKEMLFAIKPEDEDRDVFRLRLHAIVASEVSGIRTIPIIPVESFQVSMSSDPTPNVIHVVIDNLPVPIENTPWEQIKEFRSDPDSRNKLWRLQRWMVKMSSGLFPRSEIEEELIWLLHEYTEHMKLHRMKCNQGLLETVIKAPLEFLEELPKLKWSKLIEPFLAIRRRKIALLEAELSAPGREVSYLLKAREDLT